MFKNILIGIFLVATAAFAYLYETEKSKNIELSINNTKVERELIYIDSLSVLKDVTIAEQDSANKAYVKEIAEINWSYEKLAEELKAKNVELKNMTLDSIAAFIVRTHLGDTYKIKRINDSTFVVFQEVTVRDIAKQHIEYKTLIKRSELLSREGVAKDTLIKKQAKTICILTHTTDTLLTKYKTVVYDNGRYEAKIIELTTEVDKQKGLKRIGFYTAGGLLLLLIII
jgi:hypothetical protein